MPSSSAVPVSYTSQRGETYYLHQGRTKTGKPRYYVAKTVQEGVLSTVPEGYELVESINGVVSVRKSNTAPAIPEADVEMVRDVLGRHPRLRLHRVTVVKREIVVHEPDTALDTVSELGRLLGVSAELLERRLVGKSPRYSPVMKFVPAEKGQYAVHRMTYRGQGGWSWPLTYGPLRQLARKYVPLIGTDELYEII